jgi:hypothetical protein
MNTTEAAETPCSNWKGQKKMKKHLILMTAMLSFGITHNCESSVKAKDNGEACEKAFHCKSNVCTGNKCEPGKKNAGEKVIYLEECASQKVSCKPDEGIWKDELKKEKEGGANVCETIIKNREELEWKCGGGVREWECVEQGQYIGTGVGNAALACS